MDEEEGTWVTDIGPSTTGGGEMDEEGTWVTDIGPSTTGRGEGEGEGGGRVRAAVLSAKFSTASADDD